MIMSYQAVFGTFFIWFEQCKEICLLIFRLDLFVKYYFIAQLSPFVLVPPTPLDHTNRMYVQFTDSESVLRIPCVYITITHTTDTIFLWLAFVIWKIFLSRDLFSLLLFSAVEALLMFTRILSAFCPCSGMINVRSTHFPRIRRRGVGVHQPFYFLTRFKQPPPWDKQSTWARCGHTNLSLIFLQDLNNHHHEMNPSTLARGGH